MKNVSILLLDIIICIFLFQFSLAAGYSTIEYDDIGLHCILSCFEKQFLYIRCPKRDALRSNLVYTLYSMDTQFLPINFFWPFCYSLSEKDQTALVDQLFLVSFLTVYPFRILGVLPLSYNPRITLSSIFGL